MHYPRIFAILIVCAVNFAISLPQDGVISATNAPVITNNTPQSCVTGKKVAGTCIRRERCDYGTAGIDFTLYRPRGYVSSCTSEEVCCPPQYLMQQDDRVLVPENGGFDFDEDD